MIKNRFYNIEKGIENHFTIQIRKTWYFSHNNEAENVESHDNTPPVWFKKIILLGTGQFPDNCLEKKCAT